MLRALRGDNSKRSTARQPRQDSTPLFSLSDRMYAHIGKFAPPNSGGQDLETCSSYMFTGEEKLQIFTENMIFIMYSHMGVDITVR